MGPRWHLWGRLLRISLFPTAVADVLAGIVLAGGGWARPLDSLALVGASLCIYHGGMALNDWADRHEDARVRPDRPIPSGAISAGRALVVALLLFLAGPLLALYVSVPVALWVAGVGACAAAYDLFGRGAFLGPLLLGTCRAGNLSIGLVALGALESASALIWCPPLLYGLYVFLLSRLGRHEDGEESSGGLLSPSQLLFAMAAVFWSIALLPLESASEIGRGVALVLAVWASLGLIQKSRALRTWTPESIIPAMGCALRRMLVFSAAMCALPGTLESLSIAAGITALYPVAWYLRGIFPPS